MFGCREGVFESANGFKVIDLEFWKRREHYLFYKSFHCPHFNIAFQIQAEPLRAFAKARGESFFLMSLYAILKSANAVPQLRQRDLPSGRIVEFEAIDAMTPVMRDNEEFAQALLPFRSDFGAFKAEAEPLIEAVHERKSGPLSIDRCDYICASCLPWMPFTSITQAKREFNGGFVPVLAWGKISDKGEIPFSVQVNHAFTDGLHLGRFYDALSHAFQNPQTL